MAQTGCLDKSHVKIRIVRSKGTVADKVQKFPERCLLLRRISHHLLRNAREAYHVGWDESARVHKGLKAVCDFSILYENSTNLRHTVFLRR